MSVFRKLALALGVLFLATFLFVAIRVIHGWMAKPLGAGPYVAFPSVGLSFLEREKFLEGDFTIIKDMNALPSSVLHLYTEQGGTRLLMANPGERFDATDVITDRSVPRKRLIFAGVSGDKCFIHYEQGGIGLMYLLAFYKADSKVAPELIWQGHCGPAANYGNTQTISLSRVRSFRLILSIAKATSA